MSLPADESENWSPVDLAKFGKRSLCLLLLSCRVWAG